MSTLPLLLAIYLLLQIHFFVIVEAGHMFHFLLTFLLGFHINAVHGTV